MAKKTDLLYKARYGIFDYISLIRKYNKVLNEKESLELIIKDELYKKFMEKLSESMESERLRKENKTLRLKNKSLKEIIKEGKQ